jgi:NAD-dependent SIR2 family protein deacetylase
MYTMNIYKCQPELGVSHSAVFAAHGSFAREKDPVTAFTLEHAA